MERIASFQIDHTRLTPGMYLSRRDGDVDTYDLRFVRPNTPPFLPNEAMHTIEHLFATFVRNSDRRDHVVYFGPMGCRTGFYFLTRGLAADEVIDLTRDTLAFIAAYEGDIPGVSAEECGNYREHDLVQARRWASEMWKQLEKWSAADMVYPV